MRFYYDFHILVERHKEPQQTLNRKLPKLAAQHLGNVGLLDAEEIGGFGLLKAAPFHDRVDFVDQLRFDQMLLGIWDAKILKHVSASDFVAFLFPGSVPLAICSASRRRLI
jgi:hypothetical protein